MNFQGFYSEKVSQLFCKCQETVPVARPPTCLGSIPSVQWENPQISMSVGECLNRLIFSGIPIGCNMLPTSTRVYCKSFCDHKTKCHGFKLSIAHCGHCYGCMRPGYNIIKHYLMPDVGKFRAIKLMVSPNDQPSIIIVTVTATRSRDPTGSGHLRCLSHLEVLAAVSDTFWRTGKVLAATRHDETDGRRKELCPKTKWQSAILIL